MNNAQIQSKLDDCFIAQLNQLYATAFARIASGEGVYPVVSALKEGWAKNNALREALKAVQFTPDPQTKALVVPLPPQKDKDSVLPAYCSRADLIELGKRISKARWKDAPSDMQDRTSFLMGLDEGLAEVISALLQEGTADIEEEITK